MVNERKFEILCPVRDPGEARSLIKAGASEFYCGVLPQDWKEKYTNVASPNRREWTASNLQSFEELRELCRISHDHGVPVALTMNGLYTEPQYPLIRSQIQKSLDCGVDALIVADIGVISSLSEWAPGAPFYISTGGTTFNSMTVRFYRDLGASRIILPRHFRTDEIISLAKRNPDTVFEAFILNRGCKNIDGFCTFQHGVNEIRLRNLYKIPKKLNLDLAILQFLRALPEKLARRMAVPLVSGADGACFLEYDVRAVSTRLTSLEKARAKQFVKRAFCVLTGIDTCGVCSTKRLFEGGIRHFKIVGRANLTSKKLRDLRFLRYAESIVDEPDEVFRQKIRSAYRRIYRVPCRGLCYFLEEAKVG